MAATTSSRSMPVFMILIGVAAFGFALAMMLFRGAAPAVRAQTPVDYGCTQPNPDGCAIPLEVPVLAVPNDPTVAHNWLVDVPEATDFFVVAANLPADLQVWVYSPGGSLLRQSNRPGYTEEIVQVSNVGAGTYWIVVDSPGGDYNLRDPYTFLATTANLIMQPADPYAQPTQFFLPY
jgi:hypothetical protein